jgi:hypothetical protein
VDRRRFLAGALAAPVAARGGVLLGDPPAGPPIELPVVTIDPGSYHTNPLHRAVADKILAAAGESKKDCRQIDVWRDGATVTLLRRTADGHPFLQGDAPAVRHTRVRGAFLPHDLGGL